eukprot:scaffold44444_cov5024-Amphora_coffeaeformis.AAC.2
MAISSTDRRAKNVQIFVEKDAVETSFAKWAQPGHFSRTLAKGPKTTTWIWNLHADAHDFDSQTSSLEEVSPWLTDPVNIKQSSQVVWPIVGQEILNGDVGGNFQGVQTTSGWFQMWRAEGITSEVELYWIAIGGLAMSAIMLFAGWFHYHKAAPKLEWFQNAESMMNHHLAGLLGLGCLSWAGHQIHIALPINKLLDAGVAPQEIPLPHEFLTNRELMSQLYPSFSKGLAPFFSGQWGEYSDFLTFKGGLNPVTGGLWLSDIAHHHLALAVLFIVAGHMYRTNWGIGHSMKEILEAHKGPFTGEGHKGLYEILTTSWHAQLAINLAMMGSLSIIVAHHMYAMPPYPYIATDYATQLSLFTHHMWIGGFCVVGGAAHGAIFMVRDYTPANNYNNLLDRVLRHRCHAFGFYIHNDTMRALGRPQDMFSDKAIQLQPIFAQWIQNVHLLAPGTTAPNALATTSYAFGGEVVEVGGKIAMMPIQLGTADFMVHHIHAFTIHVTVLILLKGVLYARSSKLIPDKANLGFRFPCDGPGRGGTCQSSSWDHVFLDVWGTIAPDGSISHVTGGNFARGAITINGAHFIWAFSLMFLFSGRGYWQELIESIVWAHNKLNFAPAIQPRALSITQGRAVGLAHYLLGGIGTTWSFFLARALSIS